MANNAPTVPHNFGEEFFNSKYHSNIDIVLKDGTKIKVNSMVLAVNSPYFQEMIEKKSMKTIEMDEFDAAVCKQFLRGLYTGDFRTLNKEILRQVGKLSYTFQVTWMKQKCLEYFNGLMKAQPNISIDDEKFLLEEATAAKVFDKDGQYLDALAQRKTSTALCNQEILRVKTILEDLKTLPLDQLDFFIRLANKCNRMFPNQQYLCRPHGNYEYIQQEYCTVIVEQVTSHLVKIEKIDEKTRYVLEQLDFSGITAKINKNSGYQDNFKAAASKLFQSLLNLKEISNDDMKMTLKHYMSMGN